MVEFALVAVLLLMIVFGIVEFGLAFRDRLTIGNAGQSAARVGTAVGNGEEADLVMLQALEQTLANLPSSGVGIVKYVDIYKADANGDPVSSCPGAGCVRYAYTYIDGPGPLCDWSPCPPPLGASYGGPWVPSLRNVQVGNLDVMGVSIVFSHQWITGGLVPLPDVSCTSAPSNCWVDTTTMRMEPLQF
jgi:TadE-like protein